MPDTPENQKAYPQVSNQKPGLGFSIARIEAIISLTCWHLPVLAVPRWRALPPWPTGLSHYSDATLTSRLRLVQPEDLCGLRVSIGLLWDEMFAEFHIITNSTLPVLCGYPHKTLKACGYTKVMIGGPFHECHTRIDESMARRVAAPA